MSDLKFIQFFPAPTTAPVPPIRDNTHNIVGGERLAAFNAEVDDLARVIHGATYYTTPKASFDAMPKTYEIALGAVLNRKGFTKAFTADEVARNAELAAQAKRNAENAKRYEKEREAHKEAERVDRETRDELPKFEPSSPSVQRNSPSWWIERARFVEALNLKRAKHGLNPLPVR